MTKANKINILGMTAVISLGLLGQIEAQAADGYSPFYLQGTEQGDSKESAAEKVKGVKSLITMEDAAVTDEEHPFTGAEQEMDELDKLEPINDNLNVAVEAHNAINQLRGYKNIQKQYNNMVQLHDKSIQLLKDSEQCTINYMGRYFNDPVKVWSGKNMLNAPQNHDLREGLSAWAIALYETAKAAEVSPVDISDVVVVDTQSTESKDSSGNVTSVETEISSSTSTIGVDVDTSKTSDNLEELNKSGEDTVDALQEKSGGVYFKEPSRQEELEEQDRKADLISKDIGTEAALWMADYLGGVNSAGPSWNGTDLGGVKKRFPVWTDQKTFYGQYLTRKYKNITKYIKNYNISEDKRKQISDTVFERQKQYMNTAEAEITKAAVEARNTARKIRDDKVAQARKDYENNLASISAQSAEAETINREARNKIEALEAEIDSANQLRDSYMTQISDINAENNLLQQELDNTKQELSTYDELLSAEDITEEDKQSYEEAKAQINQEIKNLEGQITAQRQERDNLQQLYNEQTDLVEKKKQEITTVENERLTKIAQLNEKIAAEQKQALDALNQEVAKYDKELEEKNKSIDAAEMAAKATIGSNSMVTAQKIIAQTDMIVEDAKEIAYENIEKTLTALKNIGEELYRGKSGAVIDSYHQALMDSLRGKTTQIGDVTLEGASAKVHDITNYNTDIVISSYMDEQMREMYLDNYRESVKNTQILLEIPLMDEMLEGVDTSIDTQYFVGAQPKKEDFRAPKVIPDFNLPPLREYVRLDYIDLQSIGKDSPKLQIGKYEIPDGSSFIDKILSSLPWVRANSFSVSLVDKEKFLSYGGRIPEIWKLMLKDKAFVDSDFYLTPSMDPDSEGADIPEYNPLQLGGEMSPLYRGGIYPCVLNNIKSGENSCSVTDTIEGGSGIVDVAVIDRGVTNTEEYFLGLGFVSGANRAALLQAGLPTCQEVSASCRKKLGHGSSGFGLVDEPYLTLLNNDSESGTQSEGFVQEGDASELGTILNVYTGKLSDGTYVENVLGYSEYMQSVINYGKRMEERANQEDAADLSPSEKQNDDIYVRAQYNVNQVGDFLEHVELEQKYQQALDELEEKVKEMKDELYTLLGKFGFEPSEDFDISKAEDYDLAVKQLKSVKENYMNTAKEEINSINPGTSDLLQDSKNAYDRVYQGLLMDSEAVTQMTMDVDNLAELSEQIKTATVNNNVDDTYEANGDESFQETLDSMAPAYCAAY